MAASAPGEHFEYTFTGTGVTWISERYAGSGTVDILIDGVHDATVDLRSMFNGFGNPERMAPVYSKDGLAAGRHTIRVETRNEGAVVHDALVIRR